MISYIVKKEESGQTLEKYVKKVLSNAPLSFVYKLFRKKDVKVNGHWQDKKYVISESEEVSIYVTDSQLSEFQKSVEVKNIKDISSWIVYEDENVLLINKPRGVLVQKAKENDSALDEMVISFLVNKKEYDPVRDFGYTPAPSHRLDRNTAGLVIFGKNVATLRYLMSVMQDKNKIEKKYYALVKGHIEPKGTIDLPLFKNSKTGLVYPSKEGKSAITNYVLKKCVGEYSLVEVTLLTGRTHQIRVHFASIGHPVIGDSKYGDFKLNTEIEKKYGFKNQFLVAYHLKFNNLEKPLNYLSGKSFNIDLPQEMNDLLLKLEEE